LDEKRLSALRERSAFRLSPRFRALGGVNGRSLGTALIACLWSVSTVGAAELPTVGRALRLQRLRRLYLDLVTRYAREIAAIPLRGLYYLYCWQP
jgi:hypothetical protein